MLFVLVLSLCTASANFMYRTESLQDEPPTRNKVWIGTVLGVLASQVSYSCLLASPRDNLTEFFARCY